MPDPPVTAPRTPLETAAGVALVLVLTLLLCVWAAFLVPLRIGTTRLPVSLVVALLGNALLGRAGARLIGVPGLVAPAVLWIALASLFGSRRSEGDLVVQGDLVGTLFLAVGALGFVVAYAVTSARGAATTPPGPTGR